MSLVDYLTMVTMLLFSVEYTDVRFKSKAPFDLIKVVVDPQERSCGVALGACEFGI